MITHKLRPNDYYSVSKLYEQQDFRLNYNNIIDDRQVIYDDKMIAYGVIKKFAEIVIVVDKEVSKITRARAMIELMNDAVFLAARHNLEQIHAFVSDKRLASCLIKHFNFVQTESIVLVKNI